MSQIVLKPNDFIMERLEMLRERTGLTSIQNVLLAALSDYKPEIQPQVKKAVKATKKKLNTLGRGSRPKNLKEVIEYFKGKVAEPVEPKAKEFFDYYSQSHWRQSNGNAIKEWGFALTTWLKNDPSWRPVPKELDAPELVLNDVLDWFHVAREQAFEKYKNAKSVEEIDEYYLDEYRQNNQIL
jgi:hypothetical protein